MSANPAALVSELAPADRSLHRKLTVRIIPFLLLCYIVSFLDRVNVSFAKLQMLSELHFSETVYGLGAGIFFIGYGLLEVPSNLILYRVGPRIWIARIMLTWGIISSCMMFVHSELSFYIVRFLLGAAEAGFIPAVLYYLTLWFPSGQRGKASALFLAGIPLSGVIGAPVSGLIMHGLDGAAGLAGWQWMFLLEGIPAMLLGIACLFCLTNDIGSARWLTQDEKDRLKRTLAAESGGALLHSTRDGLLDRRVWVLSVTYFFFVLGLYGLTFWLPSLIKATGVKDPLNVGLLSAIPYAASFFAMYLVGRSSDRMRERRWHLVVPGLVGAFGLAASLFFTHDTTMAVLSLTVASMGIVTCIPQFYTLPPAILSGAAAAAGIAVINSVGNVAGFAGPYVIGAVKDLTKSSEAGILIMAASLVIAVALVFLQPARTVNR